METPFLDQLIEEHQNHIESVEAASYAGIPETRKQLAELEAIKAIIVTHCCKSDSELLPSKEEMNIKLYTLANKLKTNDKETEKIYFESGFRYCQQVIKEHLEK